MNEIHEKIDRLLHDAEHADSGIWAASMMRDTEAVNGFVAKRDRLIAEAHALDPSHSAPSWQETDLEPGKIAHAVRPAPNGDQTE